MIAIAMAAQGRWKFAQPSGTTSWITLVMRRRPSAANGGKPQHKQDRKRDFGDPHEMGDHIRCRKAVLAAEDMELELLLEQIRCARRK